MSAYAQGRPAPSDDACPVPGQSGHGDSGSKLPKFNTLVREKFEAAAREGEAPVLVASGGIRPFVRGIIERFRAQTPVLSQGEIHPRARLKTVGSI
jgi:flagellar biosynthesis protein FlhA